MSLETFLMVLLIVSTLTGLVTEGIKVLLTEWGKTYKANTLAGIAAIVLSIIVGIAYAILSGSVLNAQMVVYLVAIVLLSWLSAMVGYDKVIQAISQFKISKGE